MFSPKEKLSTALGPNTTETCNTYNMLKLTRHLFEWDPRAEYADYYERALYNHILASQNPETGMMCYYVPLRSGLAKGLQRLRRRVLVLHRYRRREPREVRRQHLLSRRRQNALRQPLHRLRAELEGEGADAAPGDELIPTSKRPGCDSRATSPSSCVVKVRHPVLGASRASRSR